MTKSSRKDRVSKDQWLAQALEVFTREGEPEMRARLFVAYTSNESLMFRFKSKEQARRLRKRCWRLLLCPPQD